MATCVSGVSSSELGAPELVHSSILRPKKLNCQWWTISWKSQTNDDKRLGERFRPSHCSGFWTQHSVSAADGWEDVIIAGWGVVVSASRRLKWKIAPHISGRHVCCVTCLPMLDTGSSVAAGVNIRSGSLFYPTAQQSVHRGEDVHLVDWWLDQRSLTGFILWFVPVWK